VRVALRRLDPAIVPFAWSRAAIWGLAAIVAATLSPDHPRAHGPTPGGHGYWYDLWANWDGAWFAQIAHHGYASGAGTPAFYPLYPAMLAVLGRVFAGQYVFAGIVLALACAAASFVLLRKLTVLELGAETASRATLALAIFPLSFFLQAVYSESLFLVLAIATFYFARKERWAFAAAALALSFLTRPTAIALWIGVLILAWRSPLRRRALEWVVPTPLAFIAFPILLEHQTGDAFAFIHAEKYWHRHFSALGPLGGIIDGAKAAGHGAHAIIATSTPPDWTYPANLDLKETAAVNVEAFAWLVLFLALTVVVWRVLGAAYGAYAAVSLAIPLAEPWNVFPLFSLPRFGLVIFPFFMVLGLLANTRIRLTVLVACSTLLLTYLVARWALWWWVA
jgi:Mannosyltransferase (PIG-V)